MSYRWGRPVSRTKLKYHVSRSAPPDEWESKHNLTALRQSTKRINAPVEPARHDNALANDG
jgi:hypothetical protein